MVFHSLGFGAVQNLEVQERKRDPQGTGKERLTRQGRVVPSASEDSASPGLNVTVQLSNEVTSGLDKRGFSAVGKKGL